MDRVFVSRDLPGDALHRLRAVANVDLVVWPDDLPPTAEELAAAVANADGLLSLLTDTVDASLFDRAPNLRVVSNLAVGVDNIDLAEAAARNIVVGHTPGILTEATADLTWALIMATRRRVVEAERAVRAGEWVTWHPTFMMGDSVHECTLGLVGFGRIAQAVARRARGFDMNVVVHTRTPPERPNSSRSGAGNVRSAEESAGNGWDVAAVTAGGDAGGTLEFVALEEVLERSDIVSLHVPLTPQTSGMIGAQELARMNSSATLINTARGAIVDELALVRALQEGTIARAGLDVVQSEPIALDHPLLGLDNCIVLPHIGSATTETRAAMADLAVDNLLAGLAGRPLPAAVSLS